MPLFQSESWCTTTQMEMSCVFSCKSNSSFPYNSWAPRLTSKPRKTATRKWPIDFTVRNWARSCYVIRIKKYPGLASTRFRIHIGLKNIHSGERIQKVAVGFPREFAGYVWTEGVTGKEKLRIQNLLKCQLCFNSAGLQMGTLYRKPIKSKQSNSYQSVGWFLRRESGEG